MSRPLLAPDGSCAVCTDGSCDLCKKMKDPGPIGASYRIVWGEQAQPKNYPQRIAPCIRLGAETGELADCKSCAGRVRLKLFACAIHEQCTLHKKKEQLACCKDCPDYLTRED